MTAGHRGAKGHWKFTPVRTKSSRKRRFCNFIKILYYFYVFDIHSKSCVDDIPSTSKNFKKFRKSSKFSNLKVFRVQTVLNCFQLSFLKSRRKCLYKTTMDQYHDTTVLLPMPLEARQQKDLGLGLGPAFRAPKYNECLVLN